MGEGRVDWRLLRRAAVRAPSIASLILLTPPPLPVARLRPVRVSRSFCPAKKVKEDCEPAEVVPGVYLGSIGAAHNKEVLQRLNITHVLTVASGFAPKHPDDFTYCVVNVADRPEETLSRHFERALKFIARALLDGGKVLVHCFAGKSRSATICAAYVMATEGTNLEETMRRIKTARPVADPNQAGVKPQFNRVSSPVTRRLQRAPFIRASASVESNLARLVSPRASGPCFKGFMRQLGDFERELLEARRQGRLLGRLQLDEEAASGRAKEEEQRAGGTGAAEEES